LPIANCRLTIHRVIADRGIGNSIVAMMRSAITQSESTMWQSAITQ
jgi:hypothetical protein